MEDQNAVEEYLREQEGKPKNLEACDERIAILEAEIVVLEVNVAKLKGKVDELRELIVDLS